MLSFFYSIWHGKDAADARQKTGVFTTNAVRYAVKFGTLSREQLSNSSVIGRRLHHDKLLAWFAS